MTDLKINAQLVKTVAGNLNTINNQIRDGFQSVQSAVSNMDKVWDGAAAKVAIDKFNEIRSIYHDNRFIVINNYVNFLLQQVGEGYTKTEETNVSLADAFK